MADVKVTLLSDTHGHLDDLFYKHLEDCDEIWHAGDFGPDIHELLASKNKKIRGVYGNIDDHIIRTIYPEFLNWETGGLNALMIHIGGKPEKYNPKARSLVKEFKPKLLIAGHSHILQVQYDKSNNLLFMNPGAAGKHGFHKKRTLLKFVIENGQPRDLNVVELPR